MLVFAEGFRFMWVLYGLFFFGRAPKCRGRVVVRAAMLRRVGKGDCGNVVSAKWRVDVET